MPFHRLHPHWSSEGASPSKSVCVPFKRNCLGFQQFLSSTTSMPTGFSQLEVMETYLPGTGTTGWGAWCGAGTPHSWSIPIFICHTWVWDQPVLHLCQSQRGFFFHSVVVGLHSALLAVLSDGCFVVQLYSWCGCVRRPAVFTSANHLVQKSQSFLPPCHKWTGFWHQLTHLFRCHTVSLES